MNWVGLLRLLLSLAASVAGIVRERQLLGAGEARAIAAALQQQNVRLRQALAARRAAGAAGADADADGVPDDDGFRRD